ncbi:PAS domain S-box protein [Phormidium yuhuli AB48]|uniref:PAS domain S-box protein n=1 Tax=Phormidium yuhuli AB48 TaxID=2940671 RepID=A0ABY5ANJ2_9CYAN|nr:adenylate/guanylate cyclase domain-containing protein [Phormidium yuhuli]USR90780.1 PAS domain S-box protein [Phormidium yuhuli AB48]
MPNFHWTTSGGESARQNLPSQPELGSRMPPSSEDNPSPVLQTNGEGVICYGNPASEPLLQVWGCGLGDRLNSPLQGAVAEVSRSGEPREVTCVCGSAYYQFKLVPLASGRWVNLYGWEMTADLGVSANGEGMVQNLSRLWEQAKVRSRNNSQELQLKIWECLSVQQHLREQQRQLNAIFQEAGIGIALLDREGRILRTNPALQRMLERQEEELQGIAFLEAIALQDALDPPLAEAKAEIQAAIAQCQSLPHKLEVCCRNQKGISFWISLGLSVIQVAGAQPPCFMVLIEDISEGKLSRDALQLTQFAIDAAADIVLWILPSGQFAYANEAAARALGYETQQLLGRSFQEIAPDFATANWDEFWQSMQQQRSFAFETRLQRGNGEIFPVDLTVNGIEFNHHQYICAFARDITERKQTEEALRMAQERSERLLLNIFPASVAKQLKQQAHDNGQMGAAIAQRFEDVTVLFADIVGFTHLCSRCTPSDLVHILNDIFSTFDRLTQERGLEKIKTIGDAYMAVGGLPEPQENNAEAVAELALAMMDEAARFSVQSGEPIILRVGLATGPVVAGVIGLNKFSYDLWGDTVNLASRMESLGVPGCIQVTQQAYERLRHRYVFEKRGKLQVKGKGETIAYLLKRRR